MGTQRYIGSQDLCQDCVQLLRRWPSAADNRHCVLFANAGQEYTGRFAVQEAAERAPAGGATAARRATDA